MTQQQTQHVQQIRGEGKSPGRPVDPQKQRAIVQAAGDLFMKQGFGATSMDQIANVAGVSKQTVYRHFETKEDLFSAVIEGRMSDFNISQDHLQQFTRDPQKFFIALAEGFVNLFSSGDCVNMHRLMMSEGGKHPELAERFYQAGPERVTQMVAEYIEQLNRQGIFDAPHPRLAVEQFVSMLKGKYHTCGLMGISVPVFDGQRDWYIQSAVTMFLGHYRRK